ncbi:glycerophosphocholine phosphodiesterase GPCPD1 isoform X1 [Rana temporaria]|uniref:glycerophosphocholine phosphodiesterase GPCPD1 isoform X1 n=1 Tax=Rana temporaria TaxID=8407 RepID=UPI001AAE1452|nr:glycerophosphocholine phosphodiesterase GPCPD1 isoform X1 [Rana temporaria]XP_040207617.1 glycerophosphocholine phosphodiesterase GPCPD1 isoform X1 [Rana temporaria]
MTPSQVSFYIRGATEPGEVIALCGSSEELGAWKPQNAVMLQPDPNDCMVWRTNVTLPKGTKVQYRYFKGFFLEPRNTGGPCQVIVHKWETHLQPRSINPLDDETCVDDGEFGLHNGVETVDSGWLTCQTELRLRLHFSEKQPVSITKKKFKKSRFRVKLSLGGFEEEGEDEDQEKPSPIFLPKMTSTFEISLISNTEYQSRHSQPECGYGLQLDRWTEFSIHTMEPDNLELLFDFFEEDLSEAVVQGDALPGHVGTACLLSSSIIETGKSNGVITLPIMSRNGRQALGKVRVDYILIKPIQGYSCEMKSSFCKYWKPRTPLDVGHRGAGNSTTTAKLAKVRENTIASLKSAANHGAAFVEFDVHLSKDHIPVIYHDLTCCISMKKKANATSLELFEIPVKELTYDQLQLLNLAHVTALKSQYLHDSLDEECSVSDSQPFPSLQTVLESVPEDVGFNIEIKWILQEKNGKWDGNLSSYFDMNIFLDIILATVLKNAGSRRIVFSCFDADICTMVRLKQNKYPILFLTQGQSEIYPELMDLRSRSTPFAMSFAQFENILGINVHTEDLLKNPHYIREAKSKGLVVFCWGDDTNDPDNRNLMRDYGIDGLIYDRIYDWNPEQPNVFKVEQMERLKKGLPVGMLRSCLCSVDQYVCNSTNCCGNLLCMDTNGVANHKLV